MLKVHLEAVDCGILEHYDNKRRKRESDDPGPKNAVIDASRDEGTRGDAQVRTMGTKLPDEFYDECLSVQRLLGMESKSNYVKLALRFLNGAVLRATDEARLTMANKPESEAGEPPNAGKTSSCEPSWSDAVTKEGES